MRILIKTIIGINLFSILTSIFLFTKSDLIYIRKLFTGKFIGDIIDDNPKESIVNNKIENLFTYGDKSLIKNVLNPKKIEVLKYLMGSFENKNCRVPTDDPRTVLTKTDCLARRIAFEVSPLFPGEKCGLSGSIPYKLEKVYEGYGCCSDFNQVFMLYAGFVGLKVREVSNTSHTGSEYYDPKVNKWKWIDTSYRTQITNNKGEIISSYKIHNMNIDESLRIVNTYPIYKKKEKVSYNRLADKGEISYALFDNIIEREKLLNTLLKFRIPRIISEIIVLTSQGFFKKQYLVIGGGLNSVVNINSIQNILFLNTLNFLFTLISLLLILQIKNHKK